MANHDDAPRWVDTVFGTLDAVAIFGGLAAVLVLPPYELGIVLCFVVGYFAWIRRAVAQKWGTPLPWDRDGWEDYNAE